MVVLSLIFTTGCWRYGKGETIGYVYAIDDGIVWDKVWYKSSAQSSDGDCYLINDDTLKEQLRALSLETNIKLKYDRHFFTWGMCPEGTGTDDEIIGFEIVNE